VLVRTWTGRSLPVAAVAVAGATATRRASREARRRRSRSQREGEDQLAGDIDLFNFIGTEEATLQPLHRVNHWIGRMNAKGLTLM